MKKDAKNDDCSVDPSFEKMEWDWINNPEGEAGGFGELVLWRKVIQQALFDFCTVGRKTQYHRLRAQDWLLKSDKNFYLVCDLAEVDAQALRNLVHRALESAEIIELLRERIFRP